MEPEHGGRQASREPATTLKQWKREPKWRRRQRGEGLRRLGRMKRQVLALTRRWREREAASLRTPQVLPESLVGQQPSQGWRTACLGAEGAAPHRAWGGRAAGRWMDSWGRGGRRWDRRGQRTGRGHSLCHTVLGTDREDQERRRGRQEGSRARWTKNGKHSRQAEQERHSKSSLKSERDRSTAGRQLYVESEIRHAWTSLRKGNRLRDREPTSVAEGEGAGGGWSGRLGSADGSSYTQNGHTGNCTHYPMINHSEKECIYMCNWITLLYGRREYNTVNQL